MGDTTNFVTGNNLSDTDIDRILTAAPADPQPVVGEDDLAFYRTDAMRWGTLGPEEGMEAALKTELEFLASLGVALSPTNAGDPWYVDGLTVGDLYRSADFSAAVTAGILRLSAPENAKGFLRFLRRTTLPAYVNQAQAVASRLPPTIHAGIAARQQAIAADGAIRKIEGLISSP